MDIQILDITQANYPTVTIANVYNQPRGRNLPSQEDDASVRLRGINLPTERPVILSGDWNQHHPMWSKGEPQPTERTQALVEWMQEHDFTMLNEKGACTYHEHRKRGATSVLDLTWANAEAMALDAAKEWAVDPELACGSDHFALKWMIDHGVTEVQNVTGSRYSFKETKPEEWKRTFEDEMSKNMERWATLQDLQAHRSTEELDEDVELITEAMKAATEENAKERKALDKARPWWTEALGEANKKRMRLREDQRAYVNRWGEQSEELNGEIRKVTNYFRRLYKHEKTKWINDTLEEATPENMWRLQGWSKGARNYPSPAIRRRNGAPAIEHEDKCDALRETLFKPPPVLENNNAPDLTREQAQDHNHVKLTREKVREAIYRHSIKKAPGVSQQPFNTVRWAWEAEGDTIFALMHHCVENGYHPRPWRQAVAVALRKPGKPDYAEPKAYRLIQLLECLGKVLEGIVARRISFMVGREDLVPPTQFGGRPSSSTNDVLLTHIEDIQAARNDGKVTSILTFDISGFFDNVNHAQLLRELRRKGIPLPLVKWVSSFLSDRKAAVCLDGRRGEMKPVKNGIPQGSPVSLILSIVYGSEILELMEARRSRRKEDMTLLMYIDDGTLRAASKSLDANVVTLRRDFIFVNEWLTKVGLSTEPEKTGLMHHSWKQDRGHSPAIKLPMPDGTETVIRAGETIRILGLYIDRKLTFNQHAQIVAQKAKKAIACTRMLANTIRGLSQSQLRMMYRACVAPILTYASPIWWTGKKIHINKLTRVQNEALQHMARAFRTTPIKALEVDMSLPPIDITMSMTLGGYANRLHKLKTTNPVLERLPEEWRQGKPATNPPPFPPRTTARKVRPVKMTQLEKLARRTYKPELGESIDPFISPPWRRTAKDHNG